MAKYIKRTKHHQLFINGGILYRAMSESPNTSKRAITTFRRQGGTVRMSDALENGISRHTLYGLRDQGLIEQVSRGVYRLAELTPLSNPDLVTVALRIPKGVVCLVSALSYHELTTEIPHEVSIAVERGKEPKPNIDHPPTRLYRFSGASFRSGIETHTVDGISIQVYSPAKTVADCFKYRNKLGIDVALAALKDWRERNEFQVSELLTQARACRVEKVMTPYIESVL